MDEHARHSRVEGERRGTPVPQWEVFVREDETDPLRHVGSVTATDADEAADHASRLFGWYAADLWTCPADSVERYSTRPLSGSEADADLEPESDAGESEPSVHDERDGTPRVTDS